MDWKSAKIPHGSKLFKAHHFNFMHKGVNYVLEVDEYSDGSFSGHGEHATDKNFVLESVSGTSLVECIDQLISKIESRS